MKNMKRVFLYLGMSSCVSTKTAEPPSNNITLEKALKTVQSPVWEPHQGSKEEAFFDSKPWLESDDELDFYSVNGEIPPYKLSNKDGDQQGRRLSELFKESSFNSESPTSLKAAGCEEAKGENDKIIPTITHKVERGKSGKSVKHHCLPSLVRSLSCGDRKKRPSPGRIAVAAG